MSNKRKVEKFEDHITWQKARVLTREIYTVTRQGTFAKDKNLTNQLQRSAISVMSNIAEGFERGRRAEFHQFTSIAKSSCGELRSQLYTALDVGYLTDEGFNKLMLLAEELGRILGGLRASLETQKTGRR
jgi:four helix bundle protein